MTLSQLETSIKRDIDAALKTELTTPRLAFAVLYRFSIDEFCCVNRLNDEHKSILLSLEDKVWTQHTYSNPTPLSPPQDLGKLASK